MTNDGTPNLWVLPGSKQGDHGGCNVRNVAGIDHVGYFG